MQSFMITDLFPKDH